MTISKKTLDRLKEFATDGDSCATALLHLLERVEALEQRPIPGTVELATPTPEAAPVATDEELYQLAYSMPSSTELRRLRRCYDLGRQHGAAQPPAAQPAPPVDARDPKCVERWPDCHSEGYDSRCCRFPKSCSCGGAPPAAQPTPPAPPAAPAGLLARVMLAIDGINDLEIEARAAIREVAAWLDQSGQHGCSLWLREEADR